MILLKNIRIIYATIGAYMVLFYHIIILEILLKIIYGTIGSTRKYHHMEGDDVERQGSRDVEGHGRRFIN